jgi:transcriptional regulator with XRE-family HTH domain
VSPDRLPSFAALLRTLRYKAGLTQEELAHGARVGVRTLRDLESGRAQRPQHSTVELLATALGLWGVEREEFAAAARGRPDLGGDLSGQNISAAALNRWLGLGPGEHDGVCWLATFQWRWSVGLAERMLAGPVAAGLGGDVAGFVGRLVDLDLVTVRHDEVDLRYWLLDPVRNVALRHGERTGILRAARDRHATVMADIATLSGPSDGPGSSAGSRRWLDDLVPDLRAALAHVRSRGDESCAAVLARHLTRWSSDL